MVVKLRQVVKEGDDMTIPKHRMTAITAHSNRMKEIRVHLSHCNQGENLGICKYGDDDCPALKGKKTSRCSLFRTDMGKCRTHDELVAVLHSYYLKYPDMFVQPLDEIPVILNTLSRVGAKIGSLYYQSVIIALFVKKGIQDKYMIA